MGKFTFKKYRIFKVFTFRKFLGDVTISLCKGIIFYIAKQNYMTLFYEDELLCMSLQQTLYLVVTIFCLIIYNTIKRNYFVTYIFPSSCPFIS